MASKSVLIVGNITGGTTNEQTLASMLTAAGHTGASGSGGVAIRPHADTNRSLAGYDVVIISSDVTNPTNTVPYDVAGKGAVVLYNTAWGPLYWDLSAATNGVSTTDMARPYIHPHPINAIAGLPPNTLIDPAWTAMASGRMLRADNTSVFPTGHGAIKVAERETDTSIDYLAMAYETGAVLAGDLTKQALGRRVLFSPNMASFDLMTTDTFDWFTAMVEWAGGDNPAGDVTPPSIPTGVGVTMAGSTANLTWTGSSDDVGVVGYEVHRSVTNGFTPGAGTLVTTVTGTSYSDTGLAVGTHYWKIKAKDTSNNLSGASTQVTGTVSGTIVIVANQDTLHRIDLSASTGGGAISFAQTSGPAVSLSVASGVATFTRPEPLTSTIVIRGTVGTETQDFVYAPDGAGGGASLILGWNPVSNDWE